MLDGIDVEVDGAVEAGEEVADAGQPFWPGLACSLKRKYRGKKEEIMNDNSQLLQHVKVPKYLGSTRQSGKR